MYDGRVWAALGSFGLGGDGINKSSLMSFSREIIGRQNKTATDSKNQFVQWGVTGVAGIYRSSSSSLSSYKLIPLSDIDLPTNFIAIRRRIHSFESELDGWLVGRGSSTMGLAEQQRFSLNMVLDFSASKLGWDSRLLAATYSVNIQNDVAKNINAPV
ncbi:hypothetical protein COLO4_08744 [Corchorus olitorius]|uniref:Uncharacterized protein n=1 Tax=Corchorus olitorius TaxID=93759 RepID=A0A1R3KEU9_9ROSI|nr:hypothetical protein COLO4_08744 [Corchorus olitorius]